MKTTYQFSIEETTLNNFTFVYYTNSTPKRVIINQHYIIEKNDFQKGDLDKQRINIKFTGGELLSIGNVSLLPHQVYGFTNGIDGTLGGQLIKTFLNARDSSGPRVSSTKILHEIFTYISNVVNDITVRFTIRDELSKYSRPSSGGKRKTHKKHKSHKRNRTRKHRKQKTHKKRKFYKRAKNRKTKRLT